MDPDTPPRRTSVWPLVIIAALLTAAVLVRFPSSSPSASLPPELPQLVAEGWLNTPAAPEVEGKVVVVDAWATWCGYCLDSLPSLADAHERFGDRAVFISLTPEPASDLQTIETTVARFDGFDWPVGYGAWPALDALGVEGYPTFFVFDAQGKPVWAGHSVPALVAQLERIL